MLSITKCKRDIHEYVTDREIIIDAPPMPSGMLLNTPSQTRSKIVSTLPGQGYL
jgi:hypothetical protein